MAEQDGAGLQRARIALVTGASRGLGAAISAALADAGWHVAVNYASDTRAAQSVVDAIRAQGGIAEKFQFDIRAPEAQRTGIEAIRRDLGPIGLLVNNATGPQPELGLSDQTWEHYLDQLSFAVKAPLELLQLLLPAWRQAGYGRVVNIGSEVAELGPATSAHYASAKGGMLAASRSWARELARDGINVNLVAPGWIPVERHDRVAQDRKQRYLDQVPSGSFGTPIDVANAVVFLASENARFITGQRLAVNGGRTFM